MSNGVFALFGVTLPSTQRSIESFASSFNMPYVTPSAPTPSWTARHNASAAFTLYLRPTYHQAVIDVVHVYRWTKIYYIYDDNDGTFYIAYSFSLYLLTYICCCMTETFVRRSLFGFSLDSCYVNDVTRNRSYAWLSVYLPYVLSGNCR